MIGLQACHRGFAPSRRAQGRERIPVLSSLVGTCPLAVITVVGSWTFEGFPLRLSLKTLLLSMCIDTPESTTNCHSSGFFEEGAGITHASLGRGLVLCFDLIDIFRQITCFSAGASFLLLRFLKCPILKCWRTRIAFLRFTLLKNSLR